MAYGLGIDTGGTFTDSVIVDMDTGSVISRSKSLTTHDDLIKGIISSLRGLTGIEKVSLVSLSSTLATNSVVEGKSCRVGLITLGKRPKNAVVSTVSAHLDAEYDMRGNEIVPLDNDSLNGILDSLKGRVDVLAVAGYLSVRYPDHENTVRMKAEKILSIPVVCAHDLTSKLGFEERVNTAVLNAGLIPIIIELINAVNVSIKDLGVNAPLMIVKGDGSLMNASTAVMRPIETIMSGPASSLTSAMVSFGIADGIIADMGGTTLDIGIVRKGFIHTLDDGAVIGGHRTRVRAADISTFGIGGDSRIYVENGKICLSSNRVVPVCVAASSNGSICERLSDSYELIAEGIGITPTDILIAEGSYSEYDPKASVKALNNMAAVLALNIDQLIDSIKDMIIEKLADCIRAHIERSRTDEGAFFDHSLKVSSEFFSSFDPKALPIVGIGAPAGTWLSKAAERVGLKFILPENFDVGNAIGAISASVTEYVELAVRAAPTDFSFEPQCRVYTGDDSQNFSSKTQAMEFALSYGKELAQNRAIASGGTDITFDTRIDEIYLDVPNNGNKIFRGADVLVRAVGRPVIDDRDV